MTHTIHNFCKKYLMPKEFAKKPLPVLYNSWYSTTFAVHCDEQIELAKRAAENGSGIIRY